MKIQIPETLKEIVCSFGKLNAIWWFDDTRLIYHYYNNYGPYLSRYVTLPEGINRNTHEVADLIDNYIILKEK